MKEAEYITLIEYCIENHLSWPAGYRLLLIGKLEGKKEGGRWLVRPRRRAVTE